ncbi:hypothetical protein [Lapidilactobacillus bayanensis]|uniref:hypothetical protein n=1 Tax=Lapidilactobacillus bayanensis TaxID=2485998 RepID=UPI000F7A35A3|nr:hypothetical protein [Lapidilactobacillus bayanensis]
MHETNRIDRLTKILIFVSGLAQLVLSQTHIAAISKLFVKEVGFYLFLFILFGIVLVPMALSFDDRHSKSYFTAALFLILTVLVGGITMSLMIGSLGDSQTKASLSDLLPSLIIISASEIFNVISFLCILSRYISVHKEEHAHAEMVKQG